MYPIGAAARIPLSLLWCGPVLLYEKPTSTYRDIARARSLAPGLLISGHTWRLRRALRRNAASHKSHSGFDALSAGKSVAAYDYPRASGAAWTTFRPPRSFQSRRFNGRKDCLYYLLSRQVSLVAATFLLHVSFLALPVLKSCYIVYDLNIKKSDVYSICLNFLIPGTFKLAVIYEASMRP
jgi:hypothetical protein